MKTKKITSRVTILQLTKESAKSIDIHDFQILSAYILNKSKEFILTHPEFELTETQEMKIKKAVARRAAGEPTAYVIGRKEFYNMDFIVNKHTLVPRPETELMVELALNEILISTPKISDLLIADIGTGSGNIIISLAHKLKNKPACNFLGIDISKEALKIARKNAKINGVGNKIEFLHGDLLSKSNKEAAWSCDNLIILANLPYLSKEIYESAPKDVRKFEPKSALYSPAKGLSHYKKLLIQLKSISKSCRLKTVGCFLEISPEQKPLLSLLIEKTFPKARIEFHKDLSGRWRICEIKITN